MIMRLFWADYMVNRESDFPSLEAYTTFRVKRDWNMTMEEAGKKFSEELMKKLIPYDKEKFGELPKVVQQA